MSAVEDQLRRCLRYAVMERHQKRLGSGETTREVHEIVIRFPTAQLSATALRLMERWSGESMIEVENFDDLIDEIRNGEQDPEKIAQAVDRRMAEVGGEGEDEVAGREYRRIMDEAISGDNEGAGLDWVPEMEEALLPMDRRRKGDLAGGFTVPLSETAQFLQTFGANPNMPVVEFRDMEVGVDVRTRMIREITQYAEVSRLLKAAGSRLEIDQKGSPGS